MAKMIDKMDLKEMKAKVPQAADMLHRLLGCSWGHSISLKESEEVEPCQEQAVQVMVIHDPNSPEQWMFQFCAEHLERVGQLTDTHQVKPNGPDSAPEL